jgi:hypothetical protein
LAAKSEAQDVLAPPPQEYLQPAVPLFRVGTNLPQTEFAPAPAGPAVPEMFRWGPVQLRPHLLYRVSYGNGLQAQPGHSSDSMINEVSPGILLDLGSHWHLDYTPTMRFYSSSGFRDTTDHAVLLNGATSYEGWTFGVSQSYASTSTPQVETGGQTDQETYNTALSASGLLSDKLSLELGVNQNFRFMGQSSAGQNLSDSREWSTMDWLNYQFWPKFGMAIGAGGGFVNMQQGSDMTYEQLQGRVNWRAGEKLTFSVSGGAEDRQFVDTSAPDLINPIFGLTVLYQLFETTSFSLNATRAVSSSYFQNQVTESTGFTGGVRQRLLGKLWLDLTGGYNNTTYKATATGITVDREDDRSFVNVRLSCPFLKRGTASVFYDYSKNSSNQNGFEYSSNQAGLELGYRY